MARYGTALYGSAVYGSLPANPNLLWAIEIDWDGDGAFEGWNEGRRCIDAQWRKGRKAVVRTGGKGFQHCDVGEARLKLDNNSGIYDIYDTSSIYYPNVRPGRLLRIGVKNTSDGSMQYQFSGIIDDINLNEYSGGHRICEVIAKDGWNFLNNKVVNIPVSEEITTGDAIQLILDAAEWPDYWGTDIDDGLDTLPYFWVTDKTAAEAIYELADSEFGTVLLKGDGTFVFHQRGTLPTTAASLDQSELLKNIQVPQPWDFLRNNIQINVYPRELVENVEIYQMVDRPSINPGESLEIWGDLNYEGRSVAANRIDQPIAPNEYTATTISIAGVTQKVEDSADGLEGFTTGMVVEISGSSIPENNKIVTIASGGVAGEFVISEQITTEAAGARITIRQAVSSFTAYKTEDGDTNTVTGTGISFNGTTEKVGDSNNGLIGFTAGMRVIISGASEPGNNGIFTLSAGGLSGEFTVTGDLTTEIAGAAITISEYTETDSVSCISTLYGSKVKNVFTNNGADVLYINSCKIRGDAIDCPNSSSVKTDVSSGEEIKSFLLDVPWQNSLNLSGNYSVFLGGYLNTNIPFPIIQMEDQPDKQFGLEVFDTISLDMAKLGIDAEDYRIGYIEHKWLSDTGQAVRTTIYTEKNIPGGATQDNILTNGDFENDLTDWTQSDAGFSIDTVDPIGDTKTLKASVASGTETLTHDRTLCDGNQTYRITAKTKDTGVPVVEMVDCPLDSYTFVASHPAYQSTNFLHLVTSSFHGYIGYYYNLYISRTLLKIDFSGVPAGKEILSSELFTGLISEGGNNAAGTVVVYPCLTTWTNNAVTWLTQPDLYPNGIGGVDVPIFANEGGTIYGAAKQYGIPLVPQTIYNMINGVIDDYGFLVKMNLEGVTGTESTLNFWKFIRTGTDIFGTSYGYYSPTTAIKYNPGGNRHALCADTYLRIYYQEYTGADYSITIKWYDDPSAGSLLRTDTLAVNNGELTANLRSLQVNSPATAESFEVIITASEGDDFYVDDIEVKPVGFY